MRSIQFIIYLLITSIGYAQDSLKLNDILVHIIESDSSIYRVYVRNEGLSLESNEDSLYFVNKIDTIGKFLYEYGNIDLGQRELDTNFVHSFETLDLEKFLYKHRDQNFCLILPKIKSVRGNLLRIDIGFYEINYKGYVQSKVPCLGLLGIYRLECHYNSLLNKWEFIFI